MQESWSATNRLAYPPSHARHIVAFARNTFEGCTGSAWTFTHGDNFGHLYTRQGERTKRRCELARRAIVPKCSPVGELRKYRGNGVSSNKLVVGAPGFEPGASCAQASRAISWKSFLFNLGFKNKTVRKVLGSGTTCGNVPPHAWSPPNFPHSEITAKVFRLVSAIRPSLRCGIESLDVPTTV